MIFVGPYSAPSVISVPGFVAPGPRELNRVIIGDDTILRIADPGLNCTIQVVIKECAGDTSSVLSMSYSREANIGNIDLTLRGGVSKALFSPGIYLFQSLFIIGELPNIEYRAGAIGHIEFLDSLIKDTVPVGDGAPEIIVPASEYQYVSEMNLIGAAVGNQTFGYFKNLESVSLYLKRITIIAQDSSDGNTVFQMVDGDSANVGDPITLASGETVKEVVLDPVETIAVNDILRSKVVSFDGGSPAQNITVRQHFSLS